MWASSDKAWAARLEGLRAFVLIAVAVAMASATAAMADNFGSVRYDPNRDQLIITVIYRGTHPNHHFSIRWGRCRKLDRPGEPAHQIAVNLLDDQGNDAAKKSYTETVRVSLAALSCRPARVSLWTPPDFHRTLDIP